MENISQDYLELLVKENPNDADLGKKIRKIVLNIKRKQNGVQQEVSK